MDRGAWQATVEGVTRAGQDLETNAATWRWGGGGGTWNATPRGATESNMTQQPENNNGNKSD